MTADRKQTAWHNDLRKAVGGPLLWIGVFVSVSSCISAFARLFHTGLVGVFRDLVDFYRGLLRPVYELVNLPHWPFHVPELAVDLFAVYMVLVGMSLRATVLSRHYREGITDVQRLQSGRSPTRRWPGHILLPSLMLMPIILATPVRDMLYGRREIHRTFRFQDSTYHDRIYLQMVGTFWAFISVPAAVIIFFVLNAYSAGPH